MARQGISWQRVSCGNHTLSTMNESDRQLATKMMEKMAAFGAQHSTKSKRMSWWARWSQPMVTAFGVLGGSTGAASLMTAFVEDEDGDGSYSFQLGWTQMIMLLQAALVVGSAAIGAQEFKLRDIRHNDTAGDCAELVNEIQSLLADQRADESEVVKAMAHFQAKMTEIQQGAPHL